MDEYLKKNEYVLCCPEIHSENYADPSMMKYGIAISYMPLMHIPLMK